MKCQDSEAMQTGLLPYFSTVLSCKQIVLFWLIRSAMPKQLSAESNSLRRVVQSCENSGLKMIKFKNIKYILKAEKWKELKNSFLIKL